MWKKYPRTTVRGRIPDRLCKGEIIVGVFFVLLHEIGQSRVLDIQRINFLTKLVDELQERVFIRFEKTDVKADHFGAVLRQDVYKRSHFGPWPGPAAFLIEAFFIDERQGYSGGGAQVTSRQETEVIGLQFDHIEDGNADMEKDHNQKDGGECEGSTH